MGIEIKVVPNEIAKKVIVDHHYSKAFPGGTRLSFGIFDDGVFIGVVCFGQGARMFNRDVPGTEKHEVLELTRLWTKDGLKKNVLSQAVGMALKKLSKDNPQLKYVFSYADGSQGHAGYIYQATNWIYIGEYSSEQGIVIHGKLVHSRSVGSKYGTASVGWIQQHVDKQAYMIDGLPKYKYIYPFNKETRRIVMQMGKAYPKLEAIKENVDEIKRRLKKLRS